MATDEQCNCLPVNGMPSREAHSQTCPRWHELNCTEDKCHCPTKPAPSLVDAEWRCELCGAPDQAVDRIEADAAEIERLDIASRAEQKWRLEAEAEIERLEALQANHWSAAAVTYERERAERAEAEQHIYSVRCQGRQDEMGSSDHGCGGSDAIACCCLCHPRYRAGERDELIAERDKLLEEIHVHLEVEDEHVKIQDNLRAALEKIRNSHDPYQIAERALAGESDVEKQDRALTSEREGNRKLAAERDNLRAALTEKGVDVGLLLRPAHRRSMKLEAALREIVEISEPSGGEYCAVSEDVIAIAEQALAGESDE